MTHRADGLRRYIEIGREEHYVIDHDLREVECPENQFLSLVQQNPTRNIDYSPSVVIG
jgi:hypothetical protein